jgi:prepilin-type N-terminal cleavage/methylation domain-containing protein
VRRTNGLTLIEILIALALLGILVSFIVSSLASSFRITKENRKSLDATSAAQRIIESVRGQWRDKKLYANNCAVLVLNPADSQFMSLSAQYLLLNADATKSGTATLTNLVIKTSAGDCGTTTFTCDSATAATRLDPLKRIVVTATDAVDTTRTLAKVTLDIVCPT